MSRNKGNRAGCADRAERGPGFLGGLRRFLGDGFREWMGVVPMSERWIGCGAEQKRWCYESLPS